MSPAGRVDRSASYPHVITSRTLPQSGYVRVARYSGIIRTVQGGDLNWHLLQRRSRVRDFGTITRIAPIRTYNTRFGADRL